MIAGIETGGTKVFCAVVDSADLTNIIDSVHITTKDPAATLEEVHDFLARNYAKDPLEAIDVASFGPLQTSPDSPWYGYITTTPKPDWANTNLNVITAGLKSPRRPGRKLGPISIDFVTDVSGPLLGETAFGATQGVANAAYVTVGTGIGVGLMVGGKLVTGHGTPGLGHIVVRRHPEDSFGGTCPYHGDCLEGLAAGPSIAKRWNRHGGTIYREIIGYYIAQLLVTITLATAPERIVLGGGVMKTLGLLDEALKRYGSLIAGYLGANHPSATAPSEFIVPPTLGDDADVIGALVLAQDMLPL